MAYFTIPQYIDGRNAVLWWLVAVPLAGPGDGARGVSNMFSTLPLAYGQACAQLNTMGKDDRLNMMLWHAEPTKSQDSTEIYEHA